MKFETYLGVCEWDCCLVLFYNTINHTALTYQKVVPKMSKCGY